MDSDFFKFVKEPLKERFLYSRKTILLDINYDPFSDDIAIMEQLYEAGKHEEVAKYDNINIALSAKAYYLKYLVFNKLQKKQEAETVMLVHNRINQCLGLTGDGTLEHPFIITRISDEKDFLEYSHEVAVSRNIMIHSNKHFDIIKTVSGKEWYFDATDCYNRKQQMSYRQGNVIQRVVKEKKIVKKKWWKFWK